MSNFKINIDEAVAQGAVEFEDLTTARERADELAIEHNAELEVIHLATDAVAYVATPVVGRRFYPYERVESPKFSAPHLEGWRPAYTRARIATVVYRSLEEGGGWLVFNTQTGEKVQVTTTIKAREVTNRMRQEAVAAE